MDNLSHGFVGMAAGELVHRCLPPEDSAQRQSQRRRLLLVTSLLSANFPDLDLFLTPLLPEPLGYLLHHRGHTHTFVYLLPQALLLAAMLTLLWPSARRLLLDSRRAVAGFCLAMTIGLALHLAMDYLNSYGIHPFYPLNAHWYFGDMVFIIEPVFWVAFGVPVLMMIRRLWLRLGLLLLLAAALVYFTQQDFLLWQSLMMLAVLGAVLAWVQYRAGGRKVTGIIAAFVTGLAFVFMQAQATGEAGKILTDRLGIMTPGTQVLDVAMTPFPSNPACWMFASIEREEGNYLARRGILSAMPEVLAPGDCPAAFAILPATARDDYSPVILFSTHRGSVNDIQQLYEQDCHFRAWMRFARIPAHEDKRAADVRFARDVNNFTAIDLEKMAAAPCPAKVPQWGIPRRDMLDLK